ncbi:MAG: caspase family protein [Candidatus Cyclobacteriaceae bacterium M3_2C_046]
MLRKRLLIFLVLMIQALGAEVVGQTTYSLNWEWMEEFDGQGHNWLGLGMADQNGSARIVNDNYCLLQAQEGQSMIIATEFPLDPAKDFEIHTQLKVDPLQPEKPYASSLASFSWGVSFNNHHQTNISFTAAGIGLVRNIAGSVEELLPAQQLKPWKPGQFNHLIISKQGQIAKVLVNDQEIGSFPYKPLFGDGLVFTAGSNLAFTIDYLRIAYRDHRMAKSQPPRIIFNGLEADQEVYQTEQTFFNLAGFITDEDGLDSFTINGNAINVYQDQFDTKVPLALGKNIIKVEAVDQTNQVNTRYLEVVRNEPRDQFITSQKRLALVIGNSRYQHAAPLKNTVNDAMDMKATLQELGFEVLSYQDLTYPDLRQAVREYSDKIDQYDVSLFFYAGHGIQVDGKNYLIPVDAKLDSKKDIAFEAIEVDKVLTILEHRDENSLNLLVLDACRNNPFRSWERGGAEGLTTITPPSGTLVAYSTSPGSFASDGYGDNGLYTNELIKQLQKSQRIEDVFINTRIAVEEKSGGNQSPWELARLRGIYFLK